MKHNFWNKKIPSLLGLFLILLGVGVTTFLVSQGGLFSIHAGPTQTPKNVRISNITENSFTVSYETDDSVPGVINYGKDSKLGQTGLDDRDQASSNISNYTIHNITVRNLITSTKYYFVIISGKDTYMENGSPFQVATGTSIDDNPPSQDPISGKIVMPEGSSPKEAIVYLTTEGSEVISTLIKPDGSYILPLNSLRGSNASSYFRLTETSILKMLAIGDNKTSNVILSINQISPVPTITLSNDYDFTQNNSAINLASSSATQTFPSFQSSATQGQPNISTPTKDQGFSDQQPQFKGTAKPNEDVQIIINSDQEIKTTVKADSNGNWNFRPSTALSPGNHTITILAKDSTGIVKTISKSFVVYASGNQIPGDNGSPTPTPQISTPTQTPSLSPTPTVITVTPTLTPTAEPTIFTNNNLGETISPTPSGLLPPTGNPLIVTAGILGIMLFAVGSLLFLSTRKLFI